MKKKRSTPSPDTARKIWLAGIGAYGRAFSEAQESLARMSGETSKVFEELVEKGEEIEKSVEQTGRAVAARVAPRGVNFDERIKRMRDRLGINADFDPLGAEERTSEDRPRAAGHPASVAAIETRLDRLEAKLDRVLDLMKALGAEQTPKTVKRAAPSKSSTKKKSTKTGTARKKKAAAAESSDT